MARARARLGFALARGYQTLLASQESKSEATSFSEALPPSGLIVRMILMKSLLGLWLGFGLGLGLGLGLGYVRVRVRIRQA